MLLSKRYQPNVWTKRKGYQEGSETFITLIDNRESESTMKIFESTNDESFLFSALSK